MVVVAVVVAAAAAAVVVVLIVVAAAASLLNFRQEFAAVTSFITLYSLHCHPLSYIAITACLALLHYSMPAPMIDSS